MDERRGLRLSSLFFVENRAYFCDFAENILISFSNCYKILELTLCFACLLLSLLLLCK